MTAPSNPLIADRQDTTRGWTGIWIAEDIQQIVEGYRSGNWIDESIGGFAASMDALAFVTDPLGTLVSWGVSWLMEQVQPLREALDWLAGDPAQITAYAQTWRNVARATAGAADDVTRAVARDVAQWTGAAADAYRDHAAERCGVLAAAAQAAEAVGEIVEGTGLLVALVRQLVRDLIAEFVSVLAVRLWEWLAEEALTLGIATPWVVAQVGALVGKWVAKIGRLLHGLVASLRWLDPVIRRLRELLRRIHGGDGPMVPRDGRVQPARPPDPNAKPRGKRTDAHPTRTRDRALRRENESADTLVQNGYEVEQNPGLNPAGKRPDYKIEGQYADCYAPDSVNLETIRGAISYKVSAGQADRIVLNLEDCPRSMDEIRDVLQRKPIAGLREILVLKDGRVIQFYPFD
jgi:contact-dependent growth inhibition (CDI) system CdiA-like toxin